MTSIIELKTLSDEQEVEYDVSPLAQDGDISSIADSLHDIEAQMRKNEEIIDKLNVDIKRLTNNADVLDYTVAVSSGLLTGMINAFFVGEFNFTELKADANKHVNKFIERYAKIRGYKENGQGLKGAISFLEGKFPVDQDNVWKGLGISSTRLHHLEDMAHHPTILGLLSSIAVCFFRTAFFDKEGKWHFVLLETSKKEIVKTWAPIVISGVLRWMVYLAESKYKEQKSRELPTPIHRLVVALSYSPAIIEILKVADNWFGHLVSDMGGSKNTAGGGMGIPGIFVSILKEISSLPFLKGTELPKFVGNLYSKGKWDMRLEMAIMEYAGKQSIPVLLNELFVRTFYFVRHLISEYNKNEGWKDMDWNNVVPWRNRTITRMITIASGAFVAVDAADAAIRAGLKSGGEPTMFIPNMALRVNFVGIGRFTIAIGSDLYMGYKCSKRKDERMHRQTEQLMLSSAKFYYRQAGMWVAAEDADEAINEMERTGMKAFDFIKENLQAMGKSLEIMAQFVPAIEKQNPKLLNDISNILKYGR